MFMSPIIKYEMAYIKQNVINIDNYDIYSDFIPEIDGYCYDLNFDKNKKLMKKSNKQQHLLWKNI